MAVRAHGSQAPPSNETIHTTANHPWLTADRGWVLAGDLRVGEAVVTLDGKTSLLLKSTNPEIWGAIPSPDGRWLAVAQAGGPKNVWQVENF